MPTSRLTRLKRLRNALGLESPMGVPTNDRSADKGGSRKLGRAHQRVRGEHSKLARLRDRH